MPTYYPTGRTRNFVVTATITADYKGGEGDDFGQMFRRPDTISVSSNGATGSLTTTDFFSDADPFGYFTSTRFLVTASYNFTSDTGDYTPNFSDPDNAYLTVDLSGTVVFTFPVEEVFWVEDITVEADADGFPDYAGTAQKDGPKARIIRFGERTRVGEDIEVDVTFGAYTHSVAVEVTSATLIEHSVTLNAQNRSFQQTDGDQETDIVCSFGYVDLRADYDYSDSLHEVDCDNGLYILSRSPGGAGVGTEVRTTGSISVHAPRHFELRGRQQGFSTTLSPHIDWKIQQKNGDIITTASDGYTWSQERYTCSSSFYLNGTDTPNAGISLDEQSEVWVALDTADMGDEDDRDWRCLILGHKWDCFKFSHDPANLPNDDGDWAAGANTTVSAGVDLAVSGGSGSATLTLPTVAKAEGFRYLEIDLYSTDPFKPFTVTIGGKSWDLETGSGPSVIRVDLCAPHSATATTDNKASRYPLDAPATGDPVDSAFWGVSVIEEIEFSGLEDGQTYTIASLDLVAVGTPTITFYSAFANWMLAWNNGSLDDTYHKPFFWSEVDGRVADQPDMFFVDLVAPGDYYSWQSLTQLAGTINGLGGWSVVTTGLTLPADGYHDRDKDAYWLGGAGATHDYAADTWKDWLDEPISGETTVPAQPGWDVVDVYGGAGNVWTGAAAYPTTATERTPLAVNKILRAQAWGLLLDSQKLPSPGSTAQLIRDSDASSRGSGTADSLGSYSTGSPYGQGNVDHHLQSGDESVPILAANRMRHRVVVVVIVPQGDGVCIRHARFGALVLARVVDEGSAIQVKVCQFEIPPYDVSQEAVSGTGLSSPSIGLEDQEVLGLAYIDGDGAKYIRNFSDNRLSWTGPIIMITGAHRIKIDDHPQTHDQVGIGFVRDSSTEGDPGVLKQTFREAGEPNFSTPVTVKNAAAADFRIEDFDFDVSYSGDMGNRIVLVCIVEGETEYTTWQSWDRGKTFRKVV